MNRLFKTIEETSYLSDFIDAYIEAMLWSTTNENSYDFDTQDLSQEAALEILADCTKFYSENLKLINDDASQAGHDFWLTREGHGAGFWDGDWDFPNGEIENVGDYLTSKSKEFGEAGLYIGDDNRLYFM